MRMIHSVLRRTPENTRSFSEIRARKKYYTTLHCTIIFIPNDSHTFYSDLTCVVLATVVLLCGPRYVVVFGSNHLHRRERATATQRTLSASNHDHVASPSPSSFRLGCHLFPPKLIIPSRSSTYSTTDSYSPSVDRQRGLLKVRLSPLHHAVLGVAMVVGEARTPQDLPLLLPPRPLARIYVNLLHRIV